MRYGVSMGLDSYFYSTNQDTSSEGFSRDEDRELGYLRKANAVHGYIVDCFADGFDDCQVIPLDPSSLAALKETARDLLESRDEAEARKEMPPTPGFFFGDTTIGAGYWGQLAELIQIVTDCEEELAAGRSVYYQASW